MRKLSITLLAISVALMPTVASADTPGCVSLGEYQKVESGQRMLHVHRLFDTSGIQISKTKNRQTRNYQPCTANSPWSVIGVEYRWHSEKKSWRVLSKWRYVA